MKDTTKDHHEKRISNYLHLQYIENAYIPEKTKRFFTHKAYSHIRSNEDVGTDGQKQKFII